ncbi:hypothetical protein C8Q75DRAFT_766947 [Abortiporus biennis]|nr:hypothetical protein C8Q75DRAFT_766947 [Abortiporus biennis]
MSEITVESLRMASDTTNIHEIKYGDVSVFRRTVTPSIRKPLWDYKKTTKLIKASQDIVRGLQALAELQISHRNINPGTVFIEERLVPLHDGKGTMVEIHGFIADFEYAYIPRMLPSDSSNHAIQTVITTMDSTLSWDKTNIKVLNSSESSGAQAIMGTLQFAAVEVLHAWRNKKSIPQTPSHDLESFIWVLFYVLYRHAHAKMTEETEKRDLSLEFRRLFGSDDFKDVIRSRANILKDADELIDSEELLGAFRRFGRKDKVLLLMVSELLQQVQASYPTRKLVTSIFDSDLKMKDGTSTTNSEEGEDSDLDLAALQAEIDSSMSGSTVYPGARDLEKFNHKTVMNLLVEYSGLFKSS